ncbi:MAG: acylneuraminate cytidylyltransferase family protein [Verrucomicrobiota bacterium]|nr:acylneuraminate cytidylyltransferase family protein [Verrucomicrobiota bacterium]
MAESPTCVALIPARAGSKRIAHKNIRRLGNHPLIAYSIAAALNCELFAEVIVSTDSPEYAAIARHYGAEVPFLRPVELAEDTSPDIEWVELTLGKLKRGGRTFDCFSILRPTSPFRKPETIQRAWGEFTAEDGVDSLRAVEKCKQHPGKMWVVRRRRMLPLLSLGPASQPWHSSQYPSLPEVWVQNASLEIAWSRVVFQGHTIAGEVVMPFFTQGTEGLDVNTHFDWLHAQHLLETGAAHLPHVSRPAFSELGSTA